MSPLLGFGVLSDQDIPRSRWLLPPSKGESGSSLLGWTCAANQLVIFSYELKFDNAVLCFPIPVTIPPKLERMRLGSVS